MVSDAGYWKTIILLCKDQSCSVVFPVSATRQEVEVSYFKITPNLFTDVEKRAVSLRMASHLLFGLYSF